jgi:sigma-B regulation protein RsbU (phosphoserine phosphatase)
MEMTILILVAVAGGLATWVYLRSAQLRRRLISRLSADLADPTTDDPVERAPITLAEVELRRDLHGALVYAIIAAGALFMAFVRSYEATAVLGLVLVPALLSLHWSRSAAKETRLIEDRFEIERRAHQTLTQENLAPRAWAGRLAPEELPDLTGFEVGRVYQAGSGLMAGDFFDVFPVGRTRVAAVVGDVAGHGIESSITAFQAKYLLRVFLRQFRDPAQALEELNGQMSAAERIEEFISLVVVVFDTEAGTLRFASAGHPTAFLWHEREVQPLRASGPLLMLDPVATYFSREIPLDPGDLVLMYTDGLAEARNGPELFGEDRVAAHLRRDPTVASSVLCKSLLDVARTFADGPIEDDVAILAIRRQ